MRHIINRGFFIALIAVASLSCKEDYQYSELVRDNRPTIPVTYPGTTSYGFNPFIVSSLAAGGPIQFTLSIPSSSGRSIKEITKVLGGGTGITVANLNAGTTATTLLNTAPIAGSGTTAVFNTTIADFKKKYSTVTTTPVALPNYTEIQFLFLVTLDDGTQIIPEPVRVRIVA